MNKKLVNDFFKFTFIIWVFTWGISVLLTQSYNLTLDNLFILILRFLGGFSPTIASYISLKRNKDVINIRDWLKKIFKIKNRISIYLMVLLFIIIQFVLLCLISGYEPGVPIYYLFWLTPVMFIQGGNEEVGWRMILQPELEKKFNFFTATLITSIIWWIWHLPLFYIVGDSHIGQNIICFGLGCIYESFELATIQRVSKEVFPCILFHCLTNALYNIFIVKDNFIGTIIISIIIISFSLIIIKIFKNKNRIIG